MLTQETNVLEKVASQLVSRWVKGHGSLYLKYPSNTICQLSCFGTNPYKQVKTQRSEAQHSAEGQQEN